MAIVFGEQCKGIASLCIGEQTNRVCFADINRRFVNSKSDWAVDRLRMRNHPRGFVETVCLSSSTLTSNLRVRAESPAHTGIYYSALTVVRLIPVSTRYPPCRPSLDGTSFVCRAVVHAVAFWLIAKALCCHGGEEFLCATVRISGE